MGSDVIYGPWRVMPSCEFGESRVIYPPRARWLGARWLELVPLLAVLCWGVEVEVRASE